MRTVLYSSYPLAQFRARETEILAAVTNVLSSQSYMLGPEVTAFESEFAAYLGVKHGVGVANGTDALEIALRALGIGAGDEVITTTMTAVATAHAVVRAGATPVLVDVEPDTLLIDPVRAAAAITPRTRALLPVHLYGMPADMDALLQIARDRNLVVLEDCAQAAGASYRGRSVGSLGDAGAFSFYPTKNLGAIGDGGFVAVNNGERDAHMRRLREYGWDGERISREPGFNSRLDEVQAAILRIKLRYLAEDTAKRRALAARYDHALAGLPIDCPRTDAQRTHAYHLYVIGTDRRDALREELKRHDIIAGIHYSPPVHRHPAFAAFIASTAPAAERAAGRILSLPLYPELTEAEQARVIDAIIGFFRS